MKLLSCRVITSLCERSLLNGGKALRSKVPPHRQGYTFEVDASLKLFLCLQILLISFLTLILFLSFAAFRIYSFSVIHKSQLFLEGLYTLHFCTISHFIFGLGFCPVLQTREESAVCDFFLVLQKLFMCSLYLVLNSPSVNPM